MPGYGQMPVDLMSFGELGLADKWTYVVLYSFSLRDTGSCHPSTEDIAYRGALSKAQVVRSLKKLKENGLIDWTKGHTGRCNEYTFPMHEMLVSG